MHVTHYIVSTHYSLRACNAGLSSIKQEAHTFGSIGARVLFSTFVISVNVVGFSTFVIVGSRPSLYFLVVI